jgi:hypothetical protein
LFLLFAGTGCSLFDTSLTPAGASEALQSETDTAPSTETVQETVTSAGDENTAEAAQTSTTTAATTTDDDDNSPIFSTANGQTIDKDGTYTVSGKVSKQILVTAKKVTLILDNADVHSSDGSAILGYYEGGKQTLTVQLKGTSTVTSDSAHGIQGKDNLVITGSGTVNITAAKDGLHGGNKLEIAGGNVNVLGSYEGAEAPEVVISGGKTVIRASDDGINAASDDRTITPSILQTGGTLTIYCTSDGVDSNGTFDVTGGTAAIFVGQTRDGDATDREQGSTISVPVLYGFVNIAKGAKLSVGDWSLTMGEEATRFCLILPGLTEGKSYDILADGQTIVTTEATTTLQGMMMGGRGGGPGGGRREGGGPPSPGGFFGW